MSLANKTRKGVSLANKSPNRKERKWKHIRLENTHPDNGCGDVGLSPKSGGSIVVEHHHESPSCDASHIQRTLWITCV